MKQRVYPLHPAGHAPSHPNPTSYDIDRDDKVTYKLVTSEESDPENGLISTVSPIGQALMGKEEGDAVKVKTPTGFRNFEIYRLTTIHDA